MSYPADKYTGGDYLSHHPTWDIEDSSWKARFVAEMLQCNHITPNSICEVGCGAGGVLAELRHTYPETELFGYDIAPDAARFWPQHQKANINFKVGDVFAGNETFDVILLLDVIEHIADPFKFLTNIRGRAEYYLFHIPLDLNALAVLYEKPLLNIRRNNGHIHCFTKNLALSLLEECEFRIMKWRYSGAAFNTPHRRVKILLAAFPRFIAYSMNKDWGVRVLGGETLFVLARGQ